MTPNTLVMFSGGLDSLGAVLKVLEEQDSIYVHHMHLNNIENRAKAEKIVVLSVMDYFRKNGKIISFSESFHEYPIFNGSFLFDGDLSSFMSGHICETTPNITQVAYGRTATDDKNPSAVRRIERANKIFNSFNHRASKIYPVKEMTKNEIYEMVPQDLKTSFWSCRRPIYSAKHVIPCSRCSTCKTMRDLKIKHHKLVI
jgi:7-cyano-7-deazaguanine synthase in queuosine biosynthesis